MTSMIDRTYEFWLVAYFLSRYGSSSNSESKINPPDMLGAATWNEAYLCFYDAINEGRTQITFRNSLKNARDSFDSHFGESGRVGWREKDLDRTPGHLAKLANDVISDWASRSPDDIEKRMSELIRNAQPNKDRELPKLGSAQLGIKQPGSKAGGKGGGRSDNAYIIGREAEDWVMDYLKKTLGDSAQSLRHHPTHGETPGYDISYVDESGQTQAIEVKGTTASTFKSFELTANEFRAAKKLGNNYTIWLITNVGNNPKPFTIPDPYYERESGNLAVTPSAWLVQGFKTA